MKEYVSPNEAFMMLDKNKIKERGKKLEFKNPLTLERAVFNGMISEGRIFYVVSGNGILLQKDSVINAYPDLLRDEYCNGESELKPPDRYFPEPHVCSLEVEDFVNTYQGNVLIDDVFCDYHLMLPELKLSLEREGVFPILDCTCGFIDCAGRFVEVKHISDEIVVWIMLYYQKERPIKSLGGCLVKENDYQEYVRINMGLDKAEKEHRKEADFKARDIIRAGKKVFIPLPLFFSRKQLAELVGKGARE